MNFRLLFVSLITVGLIAARASEPISSPAEGASATVTQPHVTAELIPERTTIEAGKPFDVILHLHSDPGWHTYWTNPGDAGLATSIMWTLPPGFSAGQIQWPTPEMHAMGGLMTFGYAGDVYLLTTITPPKKDLPKHFDIKAKAQWLVCREECIPGKAEMTVTLDSGLLNLRLPKENTELFAQARQKLPVGNTRWTVKADYTQTNAAMFSLQLEEKTSDFAAIGHLTFFPEQNNVLSALPQDADQKTIAAPDSDVGAQKSKAILSSGTKAGTQDSNQKEKGRLTQTILVVKLQQNGDKPDKLSGVLVSDQPLIGQSKAIVLSSFPVSSSSASGEAVAMGTGLVAPNENGSKNTTPLQPDSSLSNTSAPVAITPKPASDTTLIAVLGAAFIGGLILNLMPCVLPVLSLKVFSLMKHAGENPRAAWIQGAAFTAGVVVSFWLLAGLLLALRSAGNHLGWGFQMQSPGFVLGLILLFFLLGLNLFGVFELGTSLVGLDAKAVGKLDGTFSSFGNGALATLAATPCTAPFMGSALGFAAQQPGYISMLIFTVLALGMASPYFLLTIFPSALKFVPKPGAWMEAFKQFMGFLLMGTVIYLVYVFGALVGEAQVPWLLAILLLAGVAAWIYGRWSGPLHTAAVRGVAFFLAFAILGLAIYGGVGLVNGKPKAGEIGDGHKPQPQMQDGWQPWTQDAVDAALAKGQPVFVDFTAAWCLSCKVNERVALDTDAVKQAFAQRNVMLLRADWTHSDPEISKALQKFNRDGVPLYLLFSPKDSQHPQVLPAVLTPGIVLEALGKT